ncbi:MAG: FTR1 family protein [Anaerolineales bacterium]|nr:FTR1 family protein [Anaerolineales bacterium]MCX7609118.1 FTR1 family protein [Anaerolineales bacterium]MDW8227093.1 iron uptake transporter permease EfeU [Anaerolineales bacterium]
MFPAFLLSLREGLEAALIIGILLGALRKINRLDLRPSVWFGTFVAVLVSLLTAGVLAVLGISLEGRAEELFEGVTMLLAAGILTWVIFWMNRHARHLRSELEQGVRQAVSSGASRQALFGLAFLAVVREGVELALFLTATAMALQDGLILLGAFLGLAFAVALGWLLFAATVRLNLRLFFQVTSFLLLLFAAGLVAHGVHEFNEAGVIPPLIEHVWDINHLLDETSFVGEILKALFGYNGNPSLTEVLAYSLYVALVAFALWREDRPRMQTATA